jgi:hypothetical protein
MYAFLLQLLTQFTGAIVAAVYVVDQQLISSGYTVQLASKGFFGLPNIYTLVGSLLVAYLLQKALRPASKAAMPGKLQRSVRSNSVRQVVI